jgi:hypothetical protein
MHTRIVVSVLVLLSACSTAPKATPPGELSMLRDQVAQLTKRVNYLETEVKVLNPAGEFKQMTIDWVRWSDDPKLGMTMGDGLREPALLCHVVEWNGYPRMKRFTRMADQNFYLEAPGHPRVDASTGEGGMSDDTGNIRLVILEVSNGPRSLAPGVEYSIHPRNGAAEYKWNVSDKLKVTRN